MKRALFLFTLTLGILGLGTVVFLRSEDTLPAPEITEVLSDVIEATPTPIGKPVTLRISSLGISSEVEEVGYAPDRRMDVPKLPENVGWWMLGPKPGEVGSAVLAGHLDGPDGLPAVFFNLSSLKEGDTVQVEDNDGKLLEFIVTSKATYSDAAFPLDVVFAETTGRRLNLITCSGTFDPLAKNYSDRFVVFTKLVE